MLFKMLVPFITTVVSLRKAPPPLPAAPGTGVLVCAQLPMKVQLDNETFEFSAYSPPPSPPKLSRTMHDVSCSGALTQRIPLPGFDPMYVAFRIVNPSTVIDPPRPPI